MAAGGRSFSCSRMEKGMAGKKKTKKFTKRMKIKQIVVFLTILSALAILGVRVSFINYKSEDDYTKLVLEQQEESSTIIPFRRGDILDRHGNILATSIKVYNLILDPKVMLSNDKYLEPTVKALVRYLGNIEGVNEEKLKKTIEEKRESSYVVYVKHLEYEQIKEFTEAMKDTKKNPDIKGVWFEDEYKRCYPYSELASSVIGFTEAGNLGRWGIEEYYSDYLNGVNGRRFGYFDNDNQKVTEERSAVDGSNVISTIDMNIQSICQKYVEKWVKEYKPKNVAVVVADPNNGEILAMVSSNNIYDLNCPNDSKNLERYYSAKKVSKMSEKAKLKALSAMWRNYCISDTYEPGSTIKPFTIAGALEEGKIGFEDKYKCDGGEQFPGKYVACHQQGGHGKITVEQAIMYSCNDALMQIAEKEGVGNFVKYQTVFNFGMRTGIDLPGESSCEGLLYTEENMKELDLKTNSFGQNFNVTMTQMVAGFSSLINGGYYYEPHTVKQIVSSSGAVEKTVDKILVKQTVTEQTSDFLRQSMKHVVTGGTGQTAAVEGYEVGGKTGTAQKHNKEEDEYILSFLGFAPCDNPQVVCYVLVDAPDVKDPGSSSYASKLFSSIMTEVLPYMNIFPAEDNKGKEDEKNKNKNVKPSYNENREGDVIGGNRGGEEN